MITENKFTEFFCIADDFCKVFDAQITALSFKKASHFQRCCYFIGNFRCLLFRVS